MRCPTGEARITPGFCLAAKFVVHTVGPVCRDGQHDAAEIAVRETRAFLADHSVLEVIFCCFSKRDAEVYECLLRQLQNLCVPART